MAIVVEAGIERGVQNLMDRVGAQTHAVLRLEEGVEQLLRSSSLLLEAQDFLLDTLVGDQLEITLHTSDGEEPCYTEVLFGRPGNLRGLQCYAYDGDPRVAARQNFDPISQIPLSVEVADRLNELLKHSEEASVVIPQALLDITTKLLDQRPAGFKIQANL